MVSIQPQTQYLNDFNSPSMDKNPLAMLEKTCETIGLPDTPAKKSQNSPKSKDGSPTNEGKKDDGHNSSGNKKKDDTAKSPKVNSAVDKKIAHGCEPSTSMAGMFPGFPAAMFHRYLPFAANGTPMLPPNAAAGFPNPGAPFGMLPFGPPTGMPHPGMVPGMPQMLPHMPTPHIVNGRPCMTPGCQTCAITNAQMAQAQAAVIAASMGGIPQMGAGAQNPNDMMQQFLQMQFLASMHQQYANPAVAQNGVQLPPTTNNKSAIDSYNNLMAAACGQLSRQVCPYVENNVPCGHTFDNPEKMLHHYKSHLPPATSMANPTTVPTPTSTTNNITSSTPTSNEKKPTTSPKTNGLSLPSPTSANRFHPYARPSSTANPAAAAQAAQMQAQAASLAQAQQQQMQMQQMLMAAFSAGLIPPQPGTPMSNAAAMAGMQPMGNQAAFNQAAFHAMYANQARMLGAGIPGMPHT